MAHEITPWKLPDCALSVPVSTLSNRETFSEEINRTYGGDGGLNANYRQVEAAIAAANQLGSLGGLNYGIHFVFKTVGDSVIFDFMDRATMEVAKRCLPEATKVAA